MKAFRLVGLLVILAATWIETSRPAWATVFCSYYCSGLRYNGSCFLSLRSCCDMLPGLCPDGTEYQGGGCSDGQNYC